MHIKRVLDKGVIIFYWEGGRLFVKAGCRFFLAYIKKFWSLPFAYVEKFWSPLWLLEKILVPKVKEHARQISNGGGSNYMIGLGFTSR